MKKILLTTMFALAAAFAATAACTIGCRTSGEDMYADGTAVKEKEFYALVWTKGSKEFGGFNADVSTKDATDKVVAMMPNAGVPTMPGLKKVMQLLYTPVYLDDSQQAEYKDAGRLYIVLLDTRNADGSLSTPKEVAGGKVPKAINGYDTKGFVEVSKNLASITVAESNSLKISIESSIPDETLKSPVVKRIYFEGDGDDKKMVMVVTNTASYLRYTSGDVTLGSESLPKTKDAVPSNGGETPDAEIEVKVPAVGTDKLFRIIRNSVLD